MSMMRHENVGRSQIQSTAKIESSAAGHTEYLHLEALGYHAQSRRIVVSVLDLWMAMS